MEGGGRRTIDSIPDELLELVFLCLPSPVHLIRAACTCRRWRRVIGGDGGRVLRWFYGLHRPSVRIVGHYRVDERHRHPCPPGGNPVFVPLSSSPWVDTVAGRNLALDFLPQPEFRTGRWELADIRWGLLLLVQYPGPSDVCPPNGIAVCDPLARRYRQIPLSAWFRNCRLMGAFLVDSDYGYRGTISLSNFRVTCAIYRSQCGTVRACAFSSVGGRWTSGGKGAVYRARGHQFAAPIHFAGIGNLFSDWTIGDNILLRMHKQFAKLSSVVLPDNDAYAALQDHCHVLEYKYRLQWPPTMKACLP